MTVFIMLWSSAICIIVYFHYSLIFVHQCAGSESFDRIFTPEKLSRGTSPSLNTMEEENRNSDMELTVASLEEALVDSQTQCAALVTVLNSSDDHLDTVRQLNEKLERMQRLLIELRTKV